MESVYPLIRVSLNSLGGFFLQGVCPQGGFVGALRRAKRLNSPL
jgi:hypothetical protein